MENTVTDVLKNLRGNKETSIEQYKDLSTLGSRLAIMRASVKVHKIVTDGLSSLLSSSSSSSSSPPSSSSSLLLLLS